jgi:ribosomal protein L11 methylase PrmA
MLKHMLEPDLKIKQRQDPGCGSRFLSIAASKPGAKEIAAVDIDK